MYISFDEFLKMRLKVATILEAQPHPNADKLYVLKVDLGDKQAQLVAGIRNSYTTEELLGKQIVVLENLQPKALRGVESQGMLLAASSPQGPVLLTPEKEVPVGTLIR
jgi:methionyl-tRNA synthetase